MLDRLGYSIPLTVGLVLVVNALGHHGIQLVIGLSLISVALTYLILDAGSGSD